MKKLLGASAPLVLARLASAVVTFELPLAMVRVLEPRAYGTYKQYFLVAATVLLIGQLGLTQSLYYFLPRAGATRGSYLAQAIALLWPLAVLLGWLLHLTASFTLGRLGAGELLALRTPLAVTAALTLMAAPLEAALTADGRIRSAAISYAVTDVVRASAMLTAAWWSRDLRLICWAVAGVAALRVGALALLMAGGVLPLARPSLARLRRQLRFALPFAGSSLFYVGQRYSAQYAVSAWFDAATFPLFTIAAFHLPLADIVLTPITEVLMVSLGRSLGSSRSASQAQFRDAVSKLAAFLVPAAAGAWLIGPVALPLLFTGRYRAAVPLFMLATLEFPLLAIPVDALLRAAGDTRFLLWFNGLRVLVTVALVLCGLRLGQMAGAIIGGLAAEAFARAVMLARGRRFLGACSRLFDWRLLERVAAAAALACLPAWLGGRCLHSAAARVTASIAIYAAAYFTSLRLLSTRDPASVPEGVTLAYSAVHSD